MKILKNQAKFTIERSNRSLNKIIKLKFFFANWAWHSEKVFSETRGRYTKLFGGKQDTKRTDPQIYSNRIASEFDQYINSLIFHSCDGRMADIKALERSSYLDFCSFLNSYLDKVEKRNKEIEALNQKYKSK